jgi:hypothetical protein
MGRPRQIERPRTSLALKEEVLLPKSYVDDDESNIS